jgi:hypothetical protein
MSNQPVGRIIEALASRERHAGRLKPNVFSGPV